MSAQQPAQNAPQIPDSNDSGEDQPLRTRYYYLIMTIMVVIGVVIDIAIFIGIITNAEGKVRITDRSPPVRLPRTSSPMTREGSRGRPARSATEARRAPSRCPNRCRWGPIRFRHARIEEPQDA